MRHTYTMQRSEVDSDMLNIFSSYKEKFTGMHNKILWCVVHEDFISEEPEMKEVLDQFGEVTFTLDWWNYIATPERETVHQKRN